MDGSNLINELVINGKEIGFAKIMKQLNFVEEFGYFERKFIRIYVDNNKLFIGHTFTNIKREINFDDLNTWIKYFDRI